MIQPVVWIVWLSVVAASHLLRSLATANIISLFGALFGGCQAVAELMTVRQRHAQQEPAERSVAQRRITENGVISRLQRALGPARAGQDTRARDLEYPRASRRAVLGIGLDNEGDVGVGPVDRLDGTFQGLSILEIVSRVRMVCQRRRQSIQAQGQAGCKSSDFRQRHLIILISMRGPSRPGFAVEARICHCRRY